MNLAVFISGRGSNFLSLLNAEKSGNLGSATIKVLISNKENALGINYAKENNIPVVIVSGQDWENDVISAMKEYKINLICLAGFMRIVSSKLINSMKGWIINIHPSLLPAFPGLNVHKRVLDSGFPYSGCTVHWVDEGVDTGPIIEQSVVPVLKDDDESLLSSRILKEEHRLYPSVIRRISDGCFSPKFTEGNSNE
tara:strand:+ start:756 stop:1343 length:588 start_codon:yes stop_codon:yes gene_type:complete